jgi:hypothetical protein
MAPPAKPRSGVSPEKKDPKQKCSPGNPRPIDPDQPGQEHQEAKDPQTNTCLKSQLLQRV